MSARNAALARVRAAIGADGGRAAWIGALAGIALLAGSYLSILYHVVDVVGGVGTFLLVTAAAAVLGVVLGRTLRNATAVALAVSLLVAGLAVYLLAVPPSFYVGLTVDRVLSDQLALLTGYSVLQMMKAGVWAIAVAPGPTFLVCYFAAREEYVRSATVGALTLGFFVLTGDSGAVGTLLGVLGATTAVGFSVLVRYGAARAQVEVLAVAFAVMILASVTVPAVPAGPGTGGQDVLTPDDGTVRSDLVSADERTRIGGSIRLSPKVRFRVSADDGDYWRAAAYDRFTGSSWVRTGGEDPLPEALPRPPGPRERLTQRFTAESTLDVMFAAAEPYRVEGVDARVTEHGTLAVSETLRDGDSYTVTSFAPNATAAQLRNASADYPESVTSRYLQLPESTPDRVADLAANVTAGADGPYEAAGRVETWLETNKEYSTTVNRPDGNIADSFLFEMSAGYCTYYATTMVAMLRTQGIPARFAVGYTSGQRVAEDEWVVRGLDSHAWVEVYFPEYGWVRFDPTPGDPRQSAEQSALEEARENGVEGVDTADSEDGTWTTSTTTGATPNATNATSEFNGTLASGPSTTQRRPWMSEVPAGGGGGGSNGGTPGDGGWQMPSPETLALWGLLAAGALAAAHRYGLTGRAYRAVWLRWLPASDDPDVDVERAFARVEYLLGREHRARRDDETVREYLAAVGADERARAVGTLYERTRYGGGATPEAADEARDLVAALVGDRRGPATVFNRLIS